MALKNRAAGPVRTFLGRLAVQIVLSGTAMAAIHVGLRVAPDLDTLFRPQPGPTPRATVAQAAPAPNPVQEAAARGERALPVAVADAAGEVLPPIPRAAPERPVHPTAAKPIRGVQRFDACDPACPSRDPLLVRDAVPVAVEPAPVLTGGTEFADLPDDALASRPVGSLLAAPGRVLGVAGRTAKGTWRKFEALLPF